MNTPKNFLTEAEAKDLSRLEAVVSVGFRVFYEVGNALIEISDRRLYRQTHSTFEEYCKEKWSMSARQAYRLCDAAGVVSNIAPSLTKLVTNPILPESESQVRPLTCIPTEKQAEVWNDAVESAGGKQPTARQVSESIEKIVPPNPEPQADAESAQLAKCVRHVSNSKRIEKWAAEGASLLVDPENHFQMRLTIQKLNQLIPQEENQSNVLTLERKTA